MYKFNCQKKDIFHIKGRGEVYPIKNPEECIDFNHLIGQYINMNGKEMLVLGVERSIHIPPWRKGESIVVVLK